MEIFMEALQNTLVGMGTVFAVLIFISLIISLFGFIPKIEESLKNRNKKEAPVVEVKNEAPVVMEEEEEELVGDDALVAVITAALMAYQGGTSTSKDQLVVRSIRRAKRTSRR